MGQKVMIVRRMQPQEFDVTVNLFNYYIDEAAQALPEIEEQYDSNSVIETIRLYNSHYEYVWFNAYEGTRVVGFIAGYASECPWNSEIIDANIAFIFMLDSHKNMDNFRQLMVKFEEWARTIKARNITAGDIGIDPQRTQKLYEHFDFKPGVWMNKELINE
jgi:GNAT superfamily N-acetyltransferase